MDMSQAVRFTYKNWRGEVAVRTVVPVHFWWGTTDYHPQKQWLLTAWDCDKQAHRHFAVQDINNWQPTGEVESTPANSQQTR